MNILLAIGFTGFTWDKLDTPTTDDMEAKFPEKDSIIQKFPRESVSDYSKYQ